MKEENEVLADTSGVTFSVVMPVYNGSNYIIHSLPPLVAMMQRGEVVEILMIDDGSSDDSAAVAADLGATVISDGDRGGPGAARNKAAAIAKGDVLWFVDADVVVHDDAAERLADAFREPQTAAVFGSYDDRPAALNFASQYKNLVHHHYHQKGKSEASTFWAGCGAIRKEAFLQVGGFDASRYTRPSIEDIELGYRLVAAGHRISLVPALLSTHLKVWTVWGVIKTDVLSRAVPWSRLMLRQGGLIDDLNSGKAERLRALLAGLFGLSIFAALLDVAPPWLPVFMLALTGIANWQLAKLFLRRRGPLFSLAGLIFHQFYYLYGGAAYLWCWIEARVLGMTRSA